MDRLPCVVVTAARILAAVVLMPLASLVAGACLAVTVPRRLAEKAGSESVMGLALGPAGAIAGLAFGLVVMGPCAALGWAIFGPEAPEDPFALQTVARVAHQSIPRHSEVRANAVRSLEENHLDFSSRVICAMHAHVVAPKPTGGAPAKVSGILIMHHGLHSHGGAARMLHIAVHFARRGFRVYSMDAIGHGRSGGKWGTIPTLETLARNFARAIRSIRETEGPNTPIFLKGASMGGLMVLWASAMTTGVAGVISVCPALAIGDSASSKPLVEFFKLMPVTLLGKIFPQLPLTKGPRGISFSDDPKLKKLAEEESDLDPLEYKGRLKFATALTFTSTLMDPEARAALVEKLRASDVPLLLQHGTADRAVPIEGSRAFCQSVARRRKAKLIEYEGKSHVLLSEDEATREKYLNDMYTFAKSIQ